MTDDGILVGLLEDVRARGVHRTPPLVLLTRLHVLLSGEGHVYFDAVVDAGDHVPGTSYSFVAVTPSSICFLTADHADDDWRQDEWQGRTEAEIKPRMLIAWRRPLAAVVEVGLGGTVWDWLPNEGRSSVHAPAITLHFSSSDLVALPLERRRGTPSQAPDPTPVLALLRDVWTSAHG